MLVYATHSLIHSLTQSLTYSVMCCIERALVLGVLYDMVKNVKERSTAATLEFRSNIVHLSRSSYMITVFDTNRPTMSC